MSINDKKSVNITGLGNQNPVRQKKTAIRGRLENIPFWSNCGGDVLILTATRLLQKFIFELSSHIDLKQFEISITWQYKTKPKPIQHYTMPHWEQNHPFGTLKIDTANNANKCQLGQHVICLGQYQVSAVWCTRQTSHSLYLNISQHNP